MAHERIEVIRPPSKPQKLEACKRLACRLVHRTRYLVSASALCRAFQAVRAKRGVVAHVQQSPPQPAQPAQ